MGAGARAHPWDGVSPFKMHYSIAFKHQSITGRPPLGEILYPPLIVRLWRSYNPESTTVSVIKWKPGPTWSRTAQGAHSQQYLYTLTTRRPSRRMYVHSTAVCRLCSSAYDNIRYDTIRYDTIRYDGSSRYATIAGLSSGRSKSSRAAVNKNRRPLRVPVVRPRR